MNNINDLQEQFENFIKQGQELLEKMKEERFANTSKNVKRWKPERDENYYYLSSFGEIQNCDYNSVVDEGCYNIGNCFKTEEEAQKELDRRLAEQELLNLCDGSLNDDWYEIEYEPKEDCFNLGWYNIITSSCYRFASEESAQKAIDTLGTDKLKLIFRID